MAKQAPMKIGILHLLWLTVLLGCFDPQAQDSIYDTDSTGASDGADSDTNIDGGSETDGGADTDLDAGVDTDTVADENPTCLDPDYPGLKNVILFIGDGMGPSQAAAGGIYRNGSPGTLAFEFFPVQGTMTTHSADNPITDSAASSTAMATGAKVRNGVISMQLPGDGRPLKTMLEMFSEAGKAVGLVTNTSITHATPAGFGAHAESRWDTASIGLQYLNASRPNVLLGGGSGLSVETIQAAGYSVVTTAAALETVDPFNVERLFGRFGTSLMPYEADGLGRYPHLSEMAVKAVDILSTHPDGYFLMTEGGLIDYAGHSNNIEKLVLEVIEFEHTIVQTLGHISLDDTLVIVTADHETGGLSIVENNGQMNLPTVQWSSSDHTATHVPVYVIGLGADRFQEAFDTKGVIDNTDIFHLVTGIFFKEECSVDKGI